MIKLKDLLKEDKFIAFYKNDRVTVTAKSLWDYGMLKNKL